MFLKIDHRITIHQNPCPRVQQHDRTVYAECTCETALVPKGTKICLLKTEDGIAYITTEDGKIGCLRVTWWTILVWRFNTVVIRDIKDWNGEDLLVAGLLLVFFFAIAFGTYALIKTAAASGEVDYCTVQVAERHGYEPPYFTVEGHRSWRGDVNLFYAKSREEADAKKLEICPK